jgi:hypothetical protein
MRYSKRFGSSEAEGHREGRPDEAPKPEGALPRSGLALTVDSPLSEEPRYLTKIISKDPVTRSVHHFRIRRIDVPELYNRLVLSSGILNPLTGRFRLVAMTLCTYVETEQFLHSFLKFPVSELRQLAKIRANVKSIQQRLDRLKGDIAGFDQKMGGAKRKLSKMCERSETALWQLLSEAYKTKGVRARKGEMRARKRAAWVFGRPALSYALRMLFEESQPFKISRREILERIGEFQIRFMKHSIVPASTVAQQIRRFTKSRHRAAKMRRIVHGLLEAEWCSAYVPAGTSESDICHLYVRMSLP